MLSDAALLDAVPDFLSIGAMFKATPADEAGKRILYFEAANEGLDQQNETVLAKALGDSSDFYLRYGNVDLDHYTQVGARLGIPDYATYELGRPLEVRQRDGRTFVKSEIYSGDGPGAEKANMVWGTLKTVPPHRWYPSVGGVTLAKAIEVDPQTNERRAVISKVRWTNVGLSKTPVNQHVPTCAMIPMGEFAKCWGAGGLDIAKALEAGYGTDSATLTGGGALREQSLHGATNGKPTHYFDFRNQLAACIQDGSAGKNPAAADLTAFAKKKFGLSDDEAAEHVERFMLDLHSGLNARKAA